MTLALHLLTGTWYNLSEGEQAFDETLQLEHVRAAVTVVDNGTRRRYVRVTGNLLYLYIGNSPQDELIIEQPGIKPTHGVIDYKKGEWIIRPIDGNRVFVNNNLVSLPERLKDGDELNFGTNTILDVILQP